MSTPNYRKRTLEDPKRVFFLCVVSLLVWDILGIQNSPTILIELCLWLILIFIFLKWKIIALVLILGAMYSWYQLWSNAYQEQEKKYEYVKNITEGFSKKLKIQGVVKKLAYRKERSNVYLVYFDNFDNFDKINDNPLDKEKSHVEQWQFIGEGGDSSVRGSFFAEIPSNLHVHPGDTIEFVWALRSNITFPLHWYHKYAFFHGGFATIFLPNFAIIKKANPPFTRKLEKTWEQLLRKSFPRDVAGVILGMTIWSTRLLTQEVKDSFLQSWITHILVVSWSNIAFLILFLTFFSKYFTSNTWVNFTLILGVLVFYMSIVWFEVPVMRAAIMGVLSYLIASAWLKSSWRAIIGIACIILIFMEPLSPVFDAGFGLSFGATLGILLFQKHTETLCTKLRIPKFFSSILSLTFGASLWSLPVLLYHFSGFPINTLITNILISWFLGWTLLSSTVFWLFSSLWVPFMKLFWFLVYVPVKTTITLSDFFRDGIQLKFGEQNWFLLAILLFGILIYHYIFEDKKT